MSWSPNLEESISLQHEMRPTFEQYEQQENYGLTTLRSKSTTLNVNEDVYEDLGDDSTPDARAELKLQAYRRQLGFPIKKTEAKEWNEDIDSEITSVIRRTGLEREPPPNYRPSLKTTRKSALQTDRLPVCGTNGLTISLDHFKFENPYFKSKPKPKPESPEPPEPSQGAEGTSDGITSQSSASTSYKSCDETTMGVAGEEFVTPRQLYLLKARRNR